MEMIRHDTRREQLVALIMKMDQSIKNNGAGRRRKDTAVLRPNSHCINCPRPLKVRETTPKVLRTLDFGRPRQSSRCRDDIASTRDECATRRVQIRTNRRGAIKQRQRPAFFLTRGGSQRHPDSQRFQPRSQNVIMLFRQDLCRRHQSGLEPGFHGQQDGRDCHNRLARPNIPLQKPVHGVFRSQTVADFFDNIFLRIR